MNTIQGQILSKLAQRRTSNLRHFHYAPLLLLCGLICGCATPAPNVNFKRSDGVPIKRVAVLIAPKPGDTVYVGRVGGGGDSIFGLIGGLVQIKNNQNRTKDFSEAIAQHKGLLLDALQTATQKALEADGFEVTFITDPQPALSPDGKAEDFSGIHVDADALLYLKISSVGYVAKRYSDYEAKVNVQARLLSAATKEVLYENMFIAGFMFDRIEKGIHLPGDPVHHFRSIENLMAHSDDAVKGIVTCEENVAKRVGDDLRPH